MRPLEANDPRSVGAYTLLGVLGQGGMGKVYLGQSWTGKRVAIKVIRSEIADDAVFRQRFVREVDAGRAISALYTAPIVDADPHADKPWFATTYIEGPSLEDEVATSGPMSVASVLILAAGLAEAFIAIHRVGLVHRDLKPSNVLLTKDGPCVIDFGIALVPDTTSLTLGVIGTPAYMSPEHVAGEDVGPPSDIFSIGATLSFAATGKGPLGQGTPHSLIARLISGQLDTSAVPEQLKPIVARCLARNAQYRPSATELLSMLAAAGATHPYEGWYSPAAPAQAVPPAPVIHPHGVGAPQARPVSPGPAPVSPGPAAAPPVSPGPAPVPAPSPAPYAGAVPQLGPAAYPGAPAAPPPVPSPAPHAGAPQSGAPYAGAPQSGSPYSGAPQPGSPYAGAPQAGSPYSGAPQAGSPYSGAPYGGAAAQSSGPPVPPFAPLSPAHPGPASGPPARPVSGSAAVPRYPATPSPYGAQQQPAYAAGHPMPPPQAHPQPGYPGYQQYPPQYGQGAPSSKRGLWITLALVALLLVGGGVTTVVVFVATNGTDPVVQPSSSAGPTSPPPVTTPAPVKKLILVAPQTLAGLTKSPEAALQTAADDLVTALKAELDGATGAVAAFYNDPQAPGQRVLFFGVTGDIVNPTAEIDDGFASIDPADAKISNIHEVSAGPLGGEAKCGDGTAGDVPVTLCVWADHESLGCAFFYNRPVDQSAQLFLKIRAEASTRP